MREKRPLVVLLVLLIVAMLPIGSVESQDKKPIVIAVPVGLSGVNSVVAPAVVQSAELAVEELNPKGGVLGRKIQLVTLDDASGTDGAVKALNTAIHQNHTDTIITMETRAAHK